MLDIVAMRQQQSVETSGRDKDGMDLRETHQAEGVGGKLAANIGGCQLASERGYNPHIKQTRRH